MRFCQALAAAGTALCFRVSVKVEARQRLLDERKEQQETAQFLLLTVGKEQARLARRLWDCASFVLAPFYFGKTEQHTRVDCPSRSFSNWLSFSSSSACRSAIMLGEGQCVFVCECIGEFVLTVSTPVD